MTDSATSNPDAGPGARLALARRRAQMSIADVATELKLPRSTIEDIESDRMDRIAPTYLRGYITNYARAVGLDPEPLLSGLAACEPAPLRSVAPVARGGHRLDRFVRFATYALVTIVIVPPLVYFFVQSGARLFESGVRAGGDEAAPVASERTDYRERVAEALAVKPLSPSADPASPLSASALPMAIGSEPASGQTEQPAVPEPAPVEGPSAELGLELSGDSWVEIESGAGERLEFDLLRAGDRRSYRGEPPFKLLLGRGSNVSLTLDGEPVRFVGQDVAGVAEFIVGAAVPAEPAADGATASGE